MTEHCFSTDGLTDSHLARCVQCQGLVWHQHLSCMAARYTIINTFSLFTDTINAITVHSVSYHQYASYTQPNKYVTFKPISECTDDVKWWILENTLLLNPSKMEAMLWHAGTVQQGEYLWCTGSCEHYCEIQRLYEGAWCQARSIHQHQSSHNRIGAKLQLPHPCVMTHSYIANAGIYKDGCTWHCGHAPCLLPLAPLQHVQW